MDEALGYLDNTSANGRTIVHEARRRCKKLRGLLHLVGPVCPDFTRENAAIRDAARLLSHLRDAEVQRQTVADLNRWRSSETLERIAARLENEPETADQPERLAQFRAQLLAVRERVTGWSLTRSGCDALLPGLRRSYRSARRRMEGAQKSGAATHFHEWRKSNKYHGFHIDLLKRAAPDILPAALEMTDALSTLLGLHHDLAVLHEALDRAPERFGKPDDGTVLLDTIEARRQPLEAEAFALGRQINAERPRALARRFAAYWKSVP
ncbi:MAG: CHAD domain-containing protein [Devosia sp.]